MAHANKNAAPDWHRDSGDNDSSASSQSIHPNSGEAQRQRLLKRLRNGPATTIELRRELDILAPAARVHELRHRFGYDIQLDWINQATDLGKVHRVGLYLLRGHCIDEGLCTTTQRGQQ